MNAIAELKKLIAIMLIANYILSDHLKATDCKILKIIMGKK